jgi:SHS2 domain-containing protein
MGFREIPHTADLALELWAPNLVALFIEAARGFNFVSGAQLGPGPRLDRNIDLAAIDSEGLLVAFLTELVYAQEQDNVGFDELSLQIVDHRLTGQLSGARLVSLAKPIKAATYHNIEIRRTDRGYEVEIVFDV